MDNRIFILVIAAIAIYLIYTYGYSDKNDTKNITDDLKDPDSDFFGMTCQGIPVSDAEYNECMNGPCTGCSWDKDDYGKSPCSDCANSKCNMYTLGAGWCYNM